MRRRRTPVQVPPYLGWPDSIHVEDDLEAVREEGPGAPSVWVMFVDIIAAPVALTFLRVTVEKMVCWLLCP